jgi:2-methylcitrate dehydratase PrpD
MARSDGTGVTRLVSEHAASLAYDALPLELVELIKQIVLDTLGVAIGASGLAPEARIVAEYVDALGGRPESTVFGFGFKAPAPWAVFVNGSLGHMLDYDDVGAGGHVGIATVPVAFAVAESLGRVSGRDLITAIAAGTDLHTRLDLAVRLPDWTMTEGWFATQLFGFLSGAVTAGRLRGFDAERIENALGIAFTQVSGSRQMAVGASTDLRSMQAGFAGQGAVLAANSRRAASHRGPLRDLQNLCAQPAGMVGADRGAGTNFPLLDEHGFKVWPACGYTRATNTATQRLRRENRLSPEDVETITVIGGTGATRLLSEPIELKRRPQLSIDGKYSIPFTTAVMMVRGNVTLRDYTEEGLRDPAVLAMADRVGYRADPDAALPIGGQSALSRPTVEIRTRDGRVLSCTPEGVPGDPAHPVGWDLLEAKFRDCVSFANRPLIPGAVERMIELAHDLDRLEDTSEILNLLG